MTAMFIKTSAIVGLLVSAALAGLVSKKNFSGAAVPGAKTDPTRLPMIGVNLASGEFAPEKLPGVHGKDYKYPTARTADPFLAMGMDTVRVPVRWERLQRVPFAPLDEREMERFDRSLQQLDGFRTIIIDLHNYGKYRSTKMDSPDSAKMLADFWVQMARRYRDSPKIAFGIMNEPYDISAGQWRGTVDLVVAAIRGAGARNLLLVPGTRWTGGHSWMRGGSGSNARAMAGFQDPANNYLFEIHQYLDGNSSGKSGKCAGPEVGSRRLADVTEWLRAQKAKGFLAEFGASSDPTCLAALNDMLRYMSVNSDVWSGWTYWAGGDWWGSYTYSIQPKDGQARPQARILEQYLTAR